MIAALLALTLALGPCFSPLPTPVPTPAPTPVSRPVEAPAGVYRYVPIAGRPPASFEALWLPLAGRTGARPHPTLMAVAQAHADELCYREQVLGEPQGYDLHVDRQGRTPNERLVDAGYPLPPALREPGNYFESVAVTHLGDRYALNILLDSPAHRAHVAGEHPFFAAQTRYGVGKACGAWYVLLTAP